MESSRKIPTLLELCMRIAIANVRYIGNVGELDIHLLKDILCHCTIHQLKNIEDATEGRDLSPVTDSLWKRFYEQHFGVDNMNLVVERMNKRKVVFKWRQLYEAKVKEREDAQNRMAEKLKQRYAENLAQKKSRQIRICSKIPPSQSKRSFFGGSGAGNNLSNLKGNLMKKAKMECLNSHEAKIHAAMRKNELQRKSFPPQSASSSTKPINLLGKDSPTSSKLAKTISRK